MEILETDIKDCLILTLPRYEDERGFFEELYREDRYTQAVAQKGMVLPREWRQINCSFSRRNVVRGLHVAPFAKLVTCLKGEVYDVVVDCRESSPTFRQWIGCRLSEANRRQIYIPPDCAHGFMGLAEENLIIYQQTGVYDPKAERSFHWRDNCLAITWPAAETYIVSEKDQQAPPFSG